MADNANIYEGAAQPGPLLFPKPVFVPKIWGGRKLNTEFGYEIPDGPVGECWAISAHPNGDCAIEGGPYAGRYLSELWRDEPALFGDVGGDRFPLLIKILDAHDWLSVQVHPDDAYAAANENGSLGKSECWYILEADDDARITIGQKAHDRDEFASMVEQGRWHELLNEIPIHQGDFFSITPGTVHAIKGALILEVQQSSDITYRVYDFDRRQKDGSLRELHMRQALDVIDFSAKAPTSGEVTAPEVDGITHLMSCKYFDVERARVRPDAPVAIERPESFICISVTDGAGGAVEVGGTLVPLAKGAHFVAPAGCGCLSFTGDLELIVSWANRH